MKVRAIIKSEVEHYILINYFSEASFMRNLKNKQNKYLREKEI